MAKSVHYIFRSAAMTRPAGLFGRMAVVKAVQSLPETGMAEVAQSMVRHNLRRRPDAGAPA